jgi:hypothetical protein
MASIVHDNNTSTIKSRARPLGLEPAAARRRRVNRTADNKSFRGRGDEPKSSNTRRNQASTRKSGRPVYRQRRRRTKKARRHIARSMTCANITSRLSPSPSTLVQAPPIPQRQQNRPSIRQALPQGYRKAFVMQDANSEPRIALCLQQGLLDFLQAIARQLPQILDFGHGQHLSIAFCVPTTRGRTRI